MRKFLFICWIVVTIGFILSSYILWQDRELSSDHKFEESHEQEQHDYWTEERMQEAEPVDMPEDSIWTIVLDWIREAFLYLLALFIFLTALLIWHYEKERLS